MADLAAAPHVLAFPGGCGADRVVPSPDEFRMLAEKLPALCWLGARDGSLVWANESWSDYTGAPLAALAGWGWTLLHHPAELPAVMAKWQAAIAGGQPFEALLTLRGRDGSYRPFISRVAPVCAADGRIVRWIGVGADVAELDAARSALRESEARYKSAMALGRMGSWEVDFTSGVRRWTPEAMALFGLDLPGGVGVVGGAGDEFQRAMHPEDRHLHAQYHELARTVGSFSAEYRIVRPSGETRWMSGYGCAVDRQADGQPRKLVNVVVDITERKAEEEHARFLMRELSHRSKNLLSVIQAIATQTARRASDFESFQHTFRDRLAAMGTSHDLLVSGAWKGSRLCELAARQLAPVAPEGDARLSVSGEPVTLSTEATEWIGLALHELTTNAVKYGSLSCTTGRLEISWRIGRGPDGSVLELDWIESDGPAVRAPASTGFGSIVTKQILEQNLAAQVTADYAATGLRWRLVAPLSTVT